MPSEYTATELSAACELLRRPTPRSEMRSVWVEYCRPGVKFVMSWTVLMPTRSRFSAVNAEIATGTSCRLASRFSAVTTSSSIVLTVWAWAAAPASETASSVLDASKWSLNFIYLLPPRSLFRLSR